MKMYILFVCVLAFHIVGAQQNAVLPTGVQVNPESIEVPDIVRNKFRSEHPNIKPAWQMIGDYYIAEYTDETTEKQKLIAYDEDSNVMRRDVEVDDGYYPKAIKDYFSKHYPKEDYTVWFSEDRGGNKIYYVNLKSNTIWFDKDGRFLLTKNGDISGK